MRYSLPRMSRKHIVLISGVLVCVVAALVTGSLYFKQGTTLQSVSPDFKALTPDNTKPEWKQSKLAGSTAAVYIFTDTIRSVPIKVSEQPLPPSFRDDPTGKTAELAESFNATSTMQVNGFTVYIGTSVKGPQSVIFSDGKLLVLIKSDTTISNGAWADYIKTLR